MIELINKLFSVGAYKENGIVYRDSDTGFRELTEEEKAQVAAAEQQEHISSYSKSIEYAIQNMLDSKAQEYRYNDMVSARSYAGYTNSFQAEATALAMWASKCWETAGTIQAEVMAGTRGLPTVEEVLAEMPVFVGTSK